ncbi:MAG TPA: endonuclease III [Bacteroidaceae bacterium]|nr:endonuclease III [Bacteroidaceae bacterium]
MEKEELYNICLDYFNKTIPIAQSELNYSSNFQLLVAVILSAQCTDKRVNIVTPALFKAYPTASHMAQADVSQIFSLIKSVTYPNSKSKYLSEMAKMLVSEFQGEVPESFDQLVKLPGVGRKTANVITAVAFGNPAMPVDTHVFRVSRRIGLVPQKCNTPICVENELTKHIPANILIKAHHWLILHGRYTCVARKPLCHKCGLTEVCSFFKKKQLPLQE